MGYYGNDSWVVVVIFAALFVLRMVAFRRRRSGQRPGGYGRGYGGFGLRGPGSGATGPASPFPGRVAEDVAPPAQATQPPVGATPGHTGIPAGWMVDPSGKHQQRYWSGTAWTERVADDGVPGVDPPPATAEPNAP